MNELLKRALASLEEAKDRHALHARQGCICPPPTLTSSSFDGWSITWEIIYDCPFHRTPPALSEGVPPG